MSRHTILLALLFGSLLPKSLVFAAGSSSGGDAAESFSITIAVDKYWNGGEAENLRKLSKSHPAVLTSEAMNLETTLGVPADQIERAAIIAVQDGLFVVLRTGKPLDQRRIVDKLVPNPTETRLDQRNHWTSDKARHVVCLADGRTILIAPPTTGQRLAQVPIAPWSAEKLSAVGDAVTSKTLLVFQLSPLFVRGLAKPDDIRSEPYRPLGAARSLQMTMAVDQGLQVIFRAVFSDQQAADRGTPALKKVLEALNGYFETAKAKMPEFLRTQQQQYPGANELAESLARALQAAQAGLRELIVLRKGNEVEATIMVKTDQPVSTAVLLLTLVPRAKKP